jgi:ubiquinone/menaquinone biosynthesis C-methylase UbiE
VNPDNSHDSDHNPHHSSEHAGGHRFPVDRLHMLKDEARYQWMPPEPVLQAAGAAPGMVAVDIGAGAGYWTAPLSKILGPAGTVYAVDVEPIMLDELRALVQEQHLANVQVVGSSETEIPLPDAIAEFAIIGFVAHEPPDPAAFIREILRLLRPDGRLLIVDWHKKPTESGPALEHRLAQEDLQTVLTEAGLNVTWLDSPTPDAYVALATRPT